jgi:diacylglycerol kinase
MDSLIRGILKGIGYALEGYVYAFKNDRHFRVNLCLSLAGTVLAVALLEGCLALLVALTNYMVLVVELINTAVERAVDTAVTGYHPTAKASKDVASSAVLTAGVFAVVVDVIYLLPALAKSLC